MEEIKGGIPIQKLYDTINTLTGIKFSDEGFIPMADKKIKYEEVQAATIQADKFKGQGILDRGFTLYEDKSPDLGVEGTDTKIHTFSTEKFGRFGIVLINKQSNPVLTKIVLHETSGKSPDKIFSGSQILMGGASATEVFPGSAMFFILDDDLTVGDQANSGQINNKQATLTFIGGAPTGSYLTESGGVMRGDLNFFKDDLRQIRLSAFDGAVEANKVTAGEVIASTAKITSIKMPYGENQTLAINNGVIESNSLNTKNAKTSILNTEELEAKKFNLGSGNISGAVEILGSLKTQDINSDGTIRGTKVYGAVYNDYAEFFPRGEESEPGDVISLNVYADDEVYCKSRAGLPVVGVHSDEYACLIGGENPTTDDPDAYVRENIERYIPVSLAGRVYTKVIGPVKKGDKLYASSIPGVASTEKNGSSFGIAVESSNKDEIKKIKVLMRG